MRRAAALVVAGALAIGGLTACGGGDGNGGSGAGGNDRSATTGTPSDPDAYVGLTKKAAIARADAAGVAWRITREDDEDFLVTQDHDPDRLNFEIDDGTVTTSTLG